MLKLKRKLFKNHLKKKSKSFNRKKANSVLIFFDLNAFFVGGGVRHTSQFELLQQFFPKAEIHFASSDSRIVELAMNSPSLASLTFKKYFEVSYEKYDCIVFLSDKEMEIADYIVSTYYKLFNRKIETSMFSISRYSYTQDAKVFFPVLTELITMKYDENVRLDCHKNKVYLSEEEVDWANKYLNDRGVTKDDTLVILHDSSSIEGKLITNEEFFNLIRLILKSEKTKILIYDVKNIGKHLYFKKNLDEEMLNRIVFITETSLREDIRLMAAKCVKVIIGPCTGMMHCASGIYNVLKNEVSPLILIYKGGFYDMGPDDGTNYWWAKNDVVDCVLKVKGVQELVSFSELEEEDNIIDYNFLYEKDVLLNQKLEDTTLITATELMNKIKPSLFTELNH